MISRKLKILTIFPKDPDDYLGCWKTRANDILFCLEYENHYFWHYNLIPGVKFNLATYMEIEIGLRDNKLI